MKTIGNIIWLIFGGFIAALLWFLVGAILYITIIGIPIARQAFKFGELMLTPFGSDVELKFDRYPVLNIVWLILFGWEMAVGYVLVGIVYCVTIIGIPFGLQWFKFAVLALLPFGAKVN